MVSLSFILAVAVGVAAGTALGWFLATTRTAGATNAVREERDGLKHEVGELRSQLLQAKTDKAAIEAQAREIQRNVQEQKDLLSTAETKLETAFRALAADALRLNNQQFLTLASERLESVHQQAASDLNARQKAIEAVVAPARESLARLDQELRVIEQNRREAQGTLGEQLKSLSSQTNRLVDALKSPTVRGRWGEIQLRRVVEIAGMVEHCDFYEQAGVTTADGRLRPDMQIRLPANKSIVVDAKAPLQAYMEALDAVSEEQRALKLRDHARQIRNHIEQLSSKAYWDACQPAPEFVVLFLPGEMFFSAALQSDPSLIEDGASRKVILATPTTLISLLKAVSYGWRQEQLAENAERISRLAQELYDRIAVMNDRFVHLGNSLGAAVRSFNETVGSFQWRVLPATRRLKELGAAGKRGIEDVTAIEDAPRPVTLPIHDDTSKPTPAK